SIRPRLSASPPAPPPASGGCAKRTGAASAARTGHRPASGIPTAARLRSRATRNDQWHHEQGRVGAGAGLLPESRLEREFDELRVKRDQVKGLFGLPRGSEAGALAGGGQPLAR